MLISNFALSWFLHSDIILLLLTGRYKPLMGKTRWRRVRKSGGNEENEDFSLSFINWLLLSLHLEIRNNDRINLDYRSAIKTILLARRGSRARNFQSVERVLQLYSLVTHRFLRLLELEQWQQRRDITTMKNGYETLAKGRKFQNKCAETS